MMNIQNMALINPYQNAQANKSMPVSQYQS